MKQGVCLEVLSNGSICFNYLIWHEDKCDKCHGVERQIEKLQDIEEKLD